LILRLQIQKLEVMSYSLPKVLVHGANSAQGIPVVKRLLQEGFSVRVFVRNNQKALSLFPKGVEIATGTLEDRGSLEQANKDVNRVFLVLPLEYRYDVAINQGQNAIDAARDAGVELIVFNTSTFIPAEITDVTAFEVKRTISQHLFQSGVLFIVLRPHFYIDNLASPMSIPSILQNVVAYPLPSEVKIPWISLEDAAAFSVLALQRPELAGSTFDISGAEALTGKETAAKFAKVFNRPFTYQQIPIDAFERGLNQVYGEPIGTGIAQIYRWRTAHPEKDDVDINATLQKFPIKLTVFEEWIQSIKWTNNSV
jgi:NAD(P)H dehydrogenase (quinone)